MGKHQPPSEGLPPREEELERLYAGEDETAAAGALVQLLELHGRRLNKLARRKLETNADLQDEALAELNLKLWEKRREFDPQRRWVTWAETLLRNGIVDLLRRRGRETGQPPPGPATADPQPPPARKKPAMGHAPEGAMDDLLAPEGPTYEDRQEQTRETTRRMKAVRECLGSLRTQPSGELPFQAYILRKWTRLGFEEIGERLGVVTSTAWKAYQKAEAFMLACLNQKLGGTQ